MNWFDNVVGWRVNTDFHAALHCLCTSAGTGQAAQLRVISLNCLLENISETFLVPLLVSNCFLENFFQTPKFPPEPEGWDLTETLATKWGFGGRRELLSLSVPQSLGVLSGWGRSWGTGQMAKNAWKAEDEGLD